MCVLLQKTNAWVLPLCSSFALCEILPTSQISDFSQAFFPMKIKHGVSVYRCSPYKRESECESMPCTDYFYDKKSKMVIDDDDDDYMTGLQVVIYQAKGLDPLYHPSIFNHHYNVVYWVEPGLESRTGLASGLTPQWNQKDTFLLENPDDFAYLHVEVQRVNSWVDPGTSHGKVVIGRSRIPFPKEYNRAKKRYFPLVRAEGEGGKLGGDILVAMKLEKILI